MNWILKKIVGTKNQRDLRKLGPLIARINELEEQYQSLSEAELKAKTDEFRNRLAEGEALDDIMCEAFAVVKNACRRLVGTTEVVCGHELLWDMIPFDVQLVGGISLHEGKIAEMATGEGKTLVATMPLYLNALAGKNVHLVTVNDYLARRDAQWMGLVYEYLGLTVGCIQNQMNPAQRREEYGKDITYGTNSEFGFDYLRDNGMAFRPEGQVQRGYHYAIIDEVDSILIDEARTPLIISGPAPTSSHQYFELKPRVEQLVRKQRALCGRMISDAKNCLAEERTEDAQLLMYQVHHGMPKHKQLMHMLEEPDVRRLHEKIENAMLTDMRKEEARELREELYFTIDERGHDASLTEKGCEALNPTDPDAYVLPDLVSSMAELDGETELSEEETMRKRQEVQRVFTERSERIHNVDQLIRAYCLYEKDVEYVVQNNQVLIVDEFTGRILPGRRWSDGLHQAVEAKEGVKIERETQTLATITIQNYFRMYDKLAGMTGTAETEASEFSEIYKLDVVVIPTNRPVRRVDQNDVVYKTQREKFRAVIDEIRDCHERGQPVLVGTVAVDTSEIISRMLKRERITHSVLNAKNHESEAEIVTRAGQPGAVTIATNMAGRGTDIKLGKGVVYIDRELVLSGTALGDKVEGGQTLRTLLEERPCGLHVIGSERHESRRIDRQLRGRCARQGDPGSSRFYVSLEDNLMRLFGSDRIAGIMSRLGLEEGQQLEHKWLNRSIETAQRRVEQQNFGIRKRTLQYDDVMNKQREVVYGFRGEIVGSEKVREHILDILHDVTVTRAEMLLADGSAEGPRAFREWVQTAFPVPITEQELVVTEGDWEDVAENVAEKIRRAYELKVAYEDEHSVELMERQILLQTIDTQWQEYLRSMDALRQGVGLRAYGQRDPLVEYKREAFDMFEELMTDIKQDIATGVFRNTTSVDSFESFLNSLPQTLIHDEVSILGGGAPPPGAPPPGPPGEMPMDLPAIGGPRHAEPIRREAPKVGRNDPCPCGSGKKYKKCCGR
jgi:preprotein translocase subunit SecA